MTAELVEFLLACIADDEAGARRCRGPEWNTVNREPGEDDPVNQEWEIIGGRKTFATILAGYAGQAEAEHVASWDPARVLAECELKRHLIEGVTGNLPLGAEGCQGHPGPWMRHGDYGPGYCRDFSDNWMGAIYADRPGYRQEWTP